MITTDQITQVTDPWNHTVVLRYDSTGRLTNIVDAASISSSFVYDGTTGWMTNLVTPYGTTVFKLTGASENFYIASVEGVVVVLDAGEKFNVLATNKLDGAILATPALVGGNIYVRTESHLSAFGN